MKQLALSLLLVTLMGTNASADDLVKVVIQTSRGDIVLALNQTRAPATTKNFLRYVDADRFVNGSFYRTVTTRPDNQPGKAVKIDVIQGGLNPNTSNYKPIVLERTSKTGLRHKNGTVSMARDGPDTATAEFFICIGAQPELDFGGKRNPDGQGFAAFGEVVSGMDVVKSIHQAKSDGQTLTPPVVIQDIRRARLAEKR